MDETQLLKLKGELVQDYAGRGCSHQDVNRSLECKRKYNTNRDREMDGTQLLKVKSERAKEHKSMLGMVAPTKVLIVSKLVSKNEVDHFH